MLSKNIIILFLLVIQFVNAQITPIEVVVDTKKTTYSTNSHSDNKLIVKNQSYDLKQKIQENIKIKSNFDLSFIKDCLSNNTYQSLLTNKTTFSIEYIGRQDGQVISCSLINYGNKVTLSEAEVECILNEAMNNTFSFSDVPNDVNQFYFNIRRYYKFK